MKVGAENKRTVTITVVLLVVAVFMMWRSFGGDDSPVTSAPAVATPGAATLPRESVNLDPTLHLEKLDQLQAIEYAGTGRDLFHFGASPPPVTAAAAAAAARGALSAPPPDAVAPPRTPPPPPPPPPIPLKFFGYADPAVGANKVFLQLGDESYVVAEGDTVEHRYLVEKIGKTSVRIKDLQTQHEQDVPLQAG